MSNGQKGFSCQICGKAKETFETTIRDHRYMVCANCKALVE